MAKCKPKGATHQVNGTRGLRTPAKGNWGDISKMFVSFGEQCSPTVSKQQSFKAIDQAVFLCLFISLSSLCQHDAIKNKYSIINPLIEPSHMFIYKLVLLKSFFCCYL